MRLFVAAWPPAPLVDLIADLPRPEVPGVRWTTPDQWHVTLRFLGEVDSEGPVVDAVRGLDVPPAEAAMGPGVRRLGSHVLMVPVDGLDAVAAGVVGATAGVGKPPDDRPFRGHLTLARVRGRRRVDLRPFAGTPLAARWPVPRIAVVESTLHPKGARYETLAEVELGPGAPERAR